MQKLFLFPLLACFIFFSACHSGETERVIAATTVADSTNIFPVTSFLRAQLQELDTMPVTPLFVIIKNGKKDSTWMKRPDIRKKAFPFLSPEIDSSTMQSFFKETSFLDQTINAYTFSYDPKKTMPDSIKLTHWDVYMNPQTNSIERIYMVKEMDSANQTTTRQLTWLVNKWYAIRTITQTPGHDAVIKEEKMIWDFDN
jgi:hypothetical protein